MGLPHFAAHCDRSDVYSHSPAEKEKATGRCSLFLMYQHDGFDSKPSCCFFVAGDIFVKEYRLYEKEGYDT